MEIIQLRFICEILVLSHIRILIGQIVDPENG